MRGIAVFLLLLALSPIANAATITFRSGDHDGFARLVLDIPVGTDWRLGRLGDGYALDLGPEDIFDTGAAFDRIPRTRLANLASVDGTGRLTFDIVCACHLTAFLFQPDKLVIDIVDGPAPALSVFEAPIDLPEATQTANLPLLPDPRLAEPPAGLSLLPNPLVAEADPRVAEAEAAIVESLARAATQGLLEIDTTAIPREPDPVSLASLPLPAQPPPDFPLFDPVTPQPAQVPFPTTPGLSVQTSIDRDRPMDPSVGTTADGSRCLDDGLFDLAAWGDDTGFGAQMAARLSALTTERDQFPEGAIEALARTYLYFGFGREAEQVLALDGQRSPDREVLHALGQIIDGDPVTGTALQEQAGCSRPVALWAALAKGDIDGTTEAERTAILSAHRVLPVHLRTLLGPRLAQLFLDAGEAETAEAIIAIGEVGHDTAPLAESLTTAEITLALDGPEQAIATLETLSGDPNRMTPEALVALIDLSIAEGKPVPDNLISLAASMRFERRGTEAETALGLAEVRALTAESRFPEALARLATGFGGLAQGQRDAEATKVFAASVTRLPDAAFLEMAFSPFPVPPTPNAENMFATRLLDLGFPDEAAGLVAGPASGADMAERRYIRASIAVALGNYTDAEATLAGMSDPRAQAIRSSIPDDPATADNTQGRSLETLWQTGAWDQLEQTDDPLLRAASQAMLTGPVPAGPNSTLAQRQTLLSEAEATRALAADSAGAVRH